MTDIEELAGQNCCWDEQDLQQPITYICTYFPCYVAIESGRNCADFRNCKSYKFYQKYPNYLKEEKEDAIAKTL